MFNTNWVYLIVFLSTVAGYGVGWYAPGNTNDLELKLQLAEQRIKLLESECKLAALPRGEIKRPSAHKDF